MKRTAIDSGLYLLLLIVIVILVTGFFLYSKVRIDRFDSALNNEDPVSTMLIIYEGEKILFSDILLYHDATGKGALVDIPPSTGSLLKQQGKIASIESLFDPTAPDAFLEKVSEIAGIEIDFHIVMGVATLSRIVDLIGGVETFIPNPVDTRIEDTIVLLPSGSLVLDGSKAETYLRYGDPGETESERISRGQSFFQSLLDGLGKVESRIAHDEMARAIMQGVTTNISLQGLTVFSAAMQRLDVENMVQLRLRGTSRMVDGNPLLFPHSDGTLLRETLMQTINSLKSENLLTEDDLRIVLEIQNGTEINGLASRTSQLYQSFGYEITRVGNAQETVAKTVIIDRTGNQQALKRVADVIRCNNTVTQSGLEEFDTELGMTADVIIILGKDFDGRYCKE